MRATAFYLSMLQKIYQFKASNISEYFSASNMKKKKQKNEKQKQTNKQTNKKELNECVYNFSVDYRTFDNVLKECLSDY